MAGLLVSGICSFLSKYPTLKMLDGPDLHAEYLRSEGTISIPGEAIQYF